MLDRGAPAAALGEFPADPIEALLHPRNRVFFEGRDDAELVEGEAPTGDAVALELAGPTAEGAEPVEVLGADREEPNGGGALAEEDEGARLVDQRW